MVPVLRLAEHVAASNLTVLLRGETGVGKEVLCDFIHARSARAAHPIVKVHCGALPEALLEAELFGYVRGAFTGATHDKSGLIETAAGGTLFLDEIGELAPATQAKLLRVLESRELRQVGAVRSTAVDVRIVSATHRDLEAMVGAGVFREDLYYRINAITIGIPPLRERREEIPDLARSFVRAACREHRRSEPALSVDALAALVGHPWAGNVRELKNTIERAVVICQTDVIQRADLGLNRFARSRPAPSPAEEAAPASPLADQIEALERRRIVEALDSCGGNQAKAAKQLGMSRRTLLRRLDAYGLSRPRKR